LAPLKKGLPRQKKAEGVYAWRIFFGYFLFLAEKESDWGFGARPLIVML
jgi:hypothetical protein